METLCCLAGSRFDLAPGPYRTTRVSAVVWLSETESVRVPAFIPIETLYERDRRRALPAEEVLAVCLMRRIDIRYRRAYTPLSRGAGLITETWEIAPCAHLHKALPYRRELLVVPKEISERIASFACLPFTGPALVKTDIILPVR